MLPIVKYPEVIRYFSRYFRDLFKHSGQYSSFKQYVTGLMVSENKTVAGICENFAFGKSANSVDHFLIHSDWSEQGLNKKRIELLHRCSELGSQPAGVCCIDDTFNHKTGTKIENVEKDFDHAEGRYVLAHKIVTCHYKDKKISYPIDLRPYYRFNEKKDKEKLQQKISDVGRQLELFDKRQRQIEKIKLLLTYQLRKKRFKTKIQLACELVDSAETLGIRAKTYVFDCWFLCNQLTQHIRSYGKDWISRLKSNRIVLFKGQRVSLKQLIASLPQEAFRKINLKHGRCYWVFTKSVKIAKLGKVRLLISYDNRRLSGEPVALVTNRRDWEAGKIVSTYLLRWGIDAFYRDAKQHLGMESYQLRTMKGIIRHWYLVFLAHCFLLLNGLRSKLIRRLKTNLDTIGNNSRAMCEEMTVSLIAWIYRYFQNNKMPLEVAELLIG